MKIKQTAMASILGFLGLTSFAGTKDWNGTFTIKNNNGDIQTVTHAPNYVQYLFFSSRGCLVFKKGASINGMTFQEDVELCTHSNIESFTGEVQKMGLIIDKNITLDSTYQD
ncbi:hypothetical protein [Legionella maceachernii]|uniref:Uncharacterized protein n=1 Tax=Legionella maceachernii TaxID=466 RepID=A0A0W0WHJ3_9GAMM|nr:hypothetical protein [Legionella maceachernii]KTD31820.1 hypothetical protein Lmac_0124 [Legionella maceachernii]SJZ97804.1 hypothetical protein SAMN02745128_01628 [Legionella maceachernii]SUP01101.1 Uncharacterised protein [Legionella maceachernii]